MKRSSKPLPKDPNQLAYEVVKMSTEGPQQSQVDRSTLSVYLAQIGRVGGLKGGKARAKKLSARKKKAIAKKAAKARWKGHRKGKKATAKEKA